MELKRKLSFILGGVFLVFTSCSNDLSDINTRLDNLDNTPKLLSIEFLAESNPMQLTANVKGEIIGDSIVNCWVPNIMSDKVLVPQIDYVGEKVMLDGMPIGSGYLKHDFNRPVTLTVNNGDKSKKYIVYVHTYTGLPIMWIETDNRQEITSKEEYLRASFKLVDNVRTRAGGDVVEDSINIKGRGNSTWTESPKKPYRLKFDNKVSLLGEAKDKSWVLLSNYTDKSMIRTQTAFYFGAISNLDYTPNGHFVELMLNGRYNGTYLLSDKIKIADHRVNVGEDGFLLEIDFLFRVLDEDDGSYFTVKHINGVVNIKDPEVDIDDDNYLYAKEYITKIDSVLFSEKFRDPNEGWQKYLDINSFVDWYLINEIAKNYDAKFASSCYMNFKRGGKLKMGPIWDFDLGYGNAFNEYDECGKVTGFHITKALWYSRLFKDPAFVSKVKERFNYFYSKREDIMREINENAMYLKYAVQENDNRWHTFYVYTWPNYDIWGSYNNEVQSMKEWLNARFEWLKVEFDKL